ncbi:MAG TPA: HPr family phosphocarrier protein [bacterium]|jgi:phosphocarrier protein|nr:HPr family phosphocarrier protein [bacterium]HNT64190.1 HPr family phosphocarrier protein [bacterium]HOX85180.1 HPr family phosphocarrier protein [bacterium]HPG44339.1 HPr family phosphocarrier protein [bacterium]HPM96897.1 HPr family phosphocarrier protein [bacterium]
MITKTLKIKNKLGIHARPAGQIVKTSSRFSASIYLSKNGNEVNAKSIMGVLMLEAGYGSEIILRIDGEDEFEALRALEELIDKNQFGEE